MSTSTDGILAYGFDLDLNEGVNLVEAGEYGELRLSYYDSEAEEVTDEDGDELGLTAIFVKRLYEGIPDALRPAVKWDFQREEAVKAHYGVWFEGHCSGDYTMYILATYAKSASRGHPVGLDFAALEAQRQAEDWDAKLAAALAVLEVTPTKPAAWLLASYWG